MHAVAVSGDKQLNNLTITTDRLRGWSACTGGYQWFLKNFPQGGEFAAVYAALQADKRFDDSGWLVEKLFAELDSTAQVGQTVLIAGADAEKIKAAVDAGAEAATTGGGANAATTGYWANAATTGEGANAATTGGGANAATTGEGANAATTGNRANAATTGYRANAATTGYRANAATTGNRANAATTGEGANAATTGYRANAATTGYRANAATTGNRANAATTGEGAVAASLGTYSKAKAGAGGAIVLAWRDSDCELLGVFSGMVGQGGIKADTWYSLNEQGQPVEVAA